MREKLIELLDDIQRCGEDFDDYEIYGMRLPNSVSNDDVADHLIASGVTIQKWIPVTERLPDDEELVLILCKNGARFVGYCGKQYCDYERRWRIKTALNSTKLLNLGRVTHWMPLPEPPKEVARNE